MTVEESLYAALIAAGTSAGSRIYPLVIPQKYITAATFQPSLTFTRISTTKQNVHDDRHSGVAYVKFQVSSWAKNHEDAYPLREQVRAALEGFVGALGGTGGVTALFITLAGERDLRDPESQLFHCSADFMIPHAV